MDTRLYLDVNHFARSTPWAHAVLRARSLVTRDGGLERLGGALFVLPGAAIALVIGQWVGRAINRPRPYDTLHGVLVLAGRTKDFSFPSDHATAAGAIIAGLFIARDRPMAIAASITDALLAFARVYVGAHYPGDVVAGLVYGALVSVIAWFAAKPIVVRVLRAGAASRFGRLVRAARPAPPDGPGPAAHPTGLDATGAVRLLSDQAVRPAIDRDGSRIDHVPSS